mmetsp:Transcript_34845/g.64473  ORF Transcript_34845/g.64473 Transcript_34845/m.64473 type:complete len:476 (+) Transcript_34845:2456-3883(+)
MESSRGMGALATSTCGVLSTIPLWSTLGGVRRMPSAASDLSTAGVWGRTSSILAATGIEGASPSSEAAPIVGSLRRSLVVACFNKPAKLFCDLISALLLLPSPPRPSSSAVEECVARLRTAAKSESLLLALSGRVACFNAVAKAESLLLALFGRVACFNAAVKSESLLLALSGRVACFNATAKSESWLLALSGRGTCFNTPLSESAARFNAAAKSLPIELSGRLSPPLSGRAVSFSEGLTPLESAARFSIDSKSLNSFSESECSNSLARLLCKSLSLVLSSFLSFSSICVSCNAVTPAPSEASRNTSTLSRENFRSSSFSFLSISIACEGTDAPGDASTLSSGNLRLSSPLPSTDDVPTLSPASCPVPLLDLLLSSSPSLDRCNFFKNLTSSSSRPSYNASNSSALLPADVSSTRDRMVAIFSSSCDDDESVSLLFRGVCAKTADASMLSFIASCGGMSGRVPVEIVPPSWSTVI